LLLLISASEIAYSLVASHQKGLLEEKILNARKRNGQLKVKRKSATGKKGNAMLPLAAK